MSGAPGFLAIAAILFLLGACVNVALDGLVDTRRP